MKKDSNFKKALNELLNLDRSDADQAFENQEEAESVSGQTDDEAQMGKSQGNQFSKVPYAEASVTEGGGIKNLTLFLNRPFHIMESLMLQNLIPELKNLFMKR